MASTFTLKRKLFFFAADGTEFTLQQAETATGLKGTAAVKAHKMGQATTNAGNTAVSQVKSAVNTANHDAFAAAGKSGDFKTLSKLQQQSTSAATTSGVRQAAENAYKTGMAHGTSAGVQSGIKTGMKTGAKNVGILQGAKNTWGRMGTIGKVGTGAALVGGSLLAGKALFGNKNKD